jgi:tRNA uridine 5-carbamoylmethylation protein Kti12
MKAKASYRPQPLPPLIAESAQRLIDSALRLDAQLRYRDEADRIHSMKVAMFCAAISLAATFGLLIFGYWAQ